MAKNLSDAEQKRMEQLATESAFGAKSDGGSSSIRKALTYKQMAGIGKNIKIGDKEYQIAPVLNIKQEEFSILVSGNPYAYALFALIDSKDEEGEYDYSKALLIFSPFWSVRDETDENGNEKRKPLCGNEDELIMFVNTLFPLSQENSELFAKIIALIIQRYRPEITETDILPYLDIPTTMMALEAICEVNPWWLARF